MAHANPSIIVTFVLYLVFMMAIGALFFFGTNEI